jgi:hypothetical protein
MPLPKFPNVRIQCEKCDKATFCKKLQPCGEFYPALDSNFNAEISLEVKLDFMVLEPA